jgi:guanylate cyclase
VRRFVELGVPEGADAATRLRVTTITLAAGMVLVLAVAWTVTYLALDLPVAAAIPLSYQLATVVALAALARTKRFEPFLRLQLGLMATLPFLLQLALGGFVASSAVCLWALVASLGAAFVAGAAAARRWFALFLVLLLVSGLVEPLVRAWAAPIADPIRIAFFVLNVGCVALTVFAFLAWALGELERSRAAVAVERERADRLLASILPRSIAERLKDSPRSIAEAHEAVTVLFVDLVAFTPVAAAAAPGDVVAGLDDLFALLDGIAERHGIEKIKTLGDAWLAASGLPEARPDHVAAALDVALAVREAVPGHWIGGRPVRVRIGVATGPVVAGVIGRTKPSYDLWGDTVNQASRLQAVAEPGAIVVTAAVAAAAVGFRFARLGPRDIKGLGTLELLALEGRA